MRLGRRTGHEVLALFEAAAPESQDHQLQLDLGRTALLGRGNVVPHNPIVMPMPKTPTIRVVAAVAERSGHFLICRRPADKRHGNLWEFPGGKLEPFETLEAAAHRELAEELGVQLGFVGPQLFAVDDPDSAFTIEFHPVELLGEPMCLEHSALAWVTIPDLLGMDLAPSDRRFAVFLSQGQPHP